MYLISIKRTPNIPKNVDHGIILNFQKVNQSLFLTMKKKVKSNYLRFRLKGICKNENLKLLDKLELKPVQKQD